MTATFCGGWRSFLFAVDHYDQRRKVLSAGVLSAASLLDEVSVDAAEVEVDSDADSELDAGVESASPSVSAGVV